MNLTRLSEAATQVYWEAATHAGNAELVLGADIGTWMQNATKLLKTWGGYLLILIGVGAFIWGGVLLIKKLMGNPQTSQQTSWVKVGALILIGGAFAGSGLGVVNAFSDLGKETFLKIGNGSALWNQGLELGSNLSLFGGTLF